MSRIAELNVRDVGQGVRDVGQGFSPADIVRGAVDVACGQAWIWGCLDCARSLQPEARNRIARLQPVSSHDEEARP